MGSSIKQIVSDVFFPACSDDPMARRLAVLREEAEARGQQLLAHLIELAEVEAEKIAEIVREKQLRRPGPGGGRDRD